MALRIFPVAASGRPTYSDDYESPRGARLHGGNDIFAAEGAPALAVDDGHVRFTTNTLGGNVAFLTSPDGEYYYSAHLSGYEGADRQVRAGDVIGYVGHTGNARSTPPHLHFEVHPLGDKATMDPFPALRAAQGGAPLPLPLGAALPRAAGVGRRASSSSLEDAAAVVVALLVLRRLTRRT